MEKKERICERFQSYNWHDARLKSFRILRTEKNNNLIDDIQFDIDLIIDPMSGQSNYQKAQLTIMNCIFIECHLNLRGKRYCSDHIYDAFCSSVSDYRNVALNEIKDSIGQDLSSDFKDHMHFKISFIPPGGEIDLVAEDFEVRLIE